MKGFRTTFILGSGATRGAIKGFNYGGCRVRPPTNNDFLTVVASFVSASKNKDLKERLHRLFNFIYEEIGFAKKYKPSMEDIFSMIYSSKDFPQVYKKERGRPAKNFIQIDDFIYLLTRIFNEIEKYVEERGGNNLYKKLVPLLENEDTVITLNYDTLLDSALINYGWDAITKYGLPTTPYNFKGFNSVKKIKNPCQANLYKLHGSFNWFTRRSREEGLNVSFAKKPAIILNPINKIWKKKSGLERQIIPPIYGKFFSHTFWQKLWAKAFNSLISCDQLIIIGCSLIETDFHLRALLGRVKVARKSKDRPFKKVVVVDPAEETFRKFKDVLRGCNVTGIKRVLDFGNFIKMNSIKEKRKVS